VAMSRSRPIGVTLLALLAGLAALNAFGYALMYLRVMANPLGPLGFFGVDPFGALMWAVSGAIWIWVTIKLWQVDPQGLQFVTILSGLNLILAAMAIIGSSTLTAMLPAIFFNGLALIYSLSPNVRKAFGLA
jgi:hypothetical protein